MKDNFVKCLILSRLNFVHIAGGWFHVNMAD